MNIPESARPTHDGYDLVDGDGRVLESRVDFGAERAYSPSFRVTSSILGRVLVAETVLTHDMLVNLETVAQDLVEAPGDDRLLHFFRAVGRFHCVVPYTNIPGGNLGFVMGGDLADVSTAKVIAPSVSLGLVVTPGDYDIFWPGYTPIIGHTPIPVAEIAWATSAPQDFNVTMGPVENRSIRTDFQNGSVGPLTDGDPANYLRVRLYYAVENLSE